MVGTETALNDPPKEWKRPRGRPHQASLGTIENDLKHQNLELWSARYRDSEFLTVISGVISGFKVETEGMY